jgi:hypothetical protein
MERYCSTGQSPQRAVAPTEEEEEEEAKMFQLFTSAVRGMKGPTIGMKASIVIIHMVKVKSTLVQTLRPCTGRTVHRRSRGIALLFQDHGFRRG